MRQGSKRGVGAGWSAATDTAPRALTRQRPTLRSREWTMNEGDGVVDSACFVTSLNAARRARYPNGATPGAT